MFDVGVKKFFEALDAVSASVKFLYTLISISLYAVQYHKTRTIYIYI